MNGRKLFCITFIFFNSLLIVLSLSSSSFAQESFAPATVVLNSGDTLQGYINSTAGRLAPRKIQFSTDIYGSSITTYLPTDVKWYRYKGGEWYFGFAGQIESSSLNQNELTGDSAMHTISDTMFVRAVMLSRASLFYARDRNDRIHLFIQKNNSDILELAYKKYYINEIVIADYRNQITKRAIMGNELYKAQLINAFADCRYLSSSILSRPISYAKNDLLTLFEEYNKCRGEKIYYKEQSDKGRANVTFAAGLNLAGVQVSSSQNIAWQGIDFENSIGFQFGAGINWTFPRMDEKWAWYNEAAIRYNSLHGSQNSTIKTAYELNMVYAKYTSMIRYQIPSKKANPYLGFGLSNNFVLFFDAEENPEISTITITDNYRTYEQGVVFGAGVTWNNINLELRFEKSNGWSDYSDLSTKFSTLYFQAGYSF